ncbi:hypothetical protein CPB84DRAFT_1778254 [Gymnopilus junonius]|uniref:Uncharacterized protein n=1 Tax=Gymnopilus junonius TaxID=109634 RepID=A0A9P5TN77_GYMJU|nr:hypothetical protein CPB84DRAFT_1778254 [Gymnopilus junonius]
MLRRLKLPHNILRTPLNRISTSIFARRFTTEQENEPRPQTATEQENDPRTQTATEQENDAFTKKYLKEQVLPQIRAILSVMDDEEDSQRWLHSTLKGSLQKAPSPHKLLEDVISFLLSKGRSSHAFTVFQRLQNAGFFPTNHILALLLTPLIHADDQDPIQVAQSIVNLILDTEYDDSQLLSLLRVFSAFDIDQGIIISVVHAYRQSQGPDYVPSPPVLSQVVTSLVHFDQLEDAMELLSRGSHRENIRDPAHKNQIFYAFIDLIRTLRNIRTEDSGSIARAVGLMGDRGWLANSKLFDVLIGREVRAGNPRVAMTMYSMMRALGPSARPTQQIFGSLFRVYRLLKPKSYKRLNSKKPVPWFRPLRALSLELDEAAKDETRPLVPRPGVLNVALRSYMRQRDYAGAIVTLESFARYGVPLSHKTYHCVVKLLVRRVWMEITGKRRGLEDEVRWADRFLGESYLDIKLSMELVNHILYLISRETFNVIDPLYPPPPEREFRELDDKGKYKVPTLLMMEHRFRPDPWDFYYEVEPLLRLLRRAVLAEHRNWSVDAADAAVESARADMLWSPSRSLNFTEDNATVPILSSATP